MDEPQTQPVTALALARAALLAVALLALWASPVSADNNRFIEREDTDNRSYDGLSGFDEAEVEIPPFPTENDLLKIVGLEQEPYDLYLDRESMVLGDDGVLRVSVLLHADNGSANVFYEGVRCATREIKTYAYGTRDGRFRAFPNPRWKDFTKLPRIGVSGYRRLLAETYLCDIEVNRALPIGHILRLARAIGPRTAEQRTTGGSK